jgi:hypothetical protein
MRNALTEAKKKVIIYGGSMSLLTATAVVTFCARAQPATASHSSRRNSSYILK